MIDELFLNFSVARGFLARGRGPAATTSLVMPEDGLGINGNPPTTTKKSYFKITHVLLSEDASQQQDMRPFGGGHLNTSIDVGKEGYS